VAGLIVLFVRAWPGARQASALAVGGLRLSARFAFLEHALATSTASNDQSVLLQSAAVLHQGGSFVFGSGLAIVPFLQQVWFTTWGGSPSTSSLTPLLWR
jgi:hypothetical protein